MLHEDRSPCLRGRGLPPWWAAVARGTLADARESDFRGVWHLTSSPPLPPTHTTTATTSTARSTTSTPLRPAPPHHKPPSSPPSPPLILKRLQLRGRVRRLIFSQSDTPTPTPRALGGKTGPHWRHGAHRGLRGSRSTDKPNYHPAAARQQKKRIASHSNPRSSEDESSSDGRLRPRHKEPSPTQGPGGRHDGLKKMNEVWYHDQPVRGPKLEQ